MNHDYAHCYDYKRGVCPKECFRGELVRDLKNCRRDLQVSFASFKGTDECLLDERNKNEISSN